MNEFSDEEIERISTEFEEAEIKELTDSYDEITIACGGKCNTHPNVTNLKVTGGLIEFDWVNNEAYKGQPIIKRHVRCVGVIIMTVKEV